jgi:hypothetical protein
MGIEDVAGEGIEHSLAENGAKTGHRHEGDIPSRQHAKEFGGVAVSVKVFAVTATLNEFALKTIAGRNLLSTTFPIDHNRCDGNTGRANGIEDGSAS